MEAKINEGLTTEELQRMIATLSTTEDNESLRTEMDDLKVALRANPAACASLLPEDIGAMVEALIKVTGKVIEEDMAKGKKKSSPKVDLQAIMSDPNKRQEIEDDLF